MTDALSEVHREIVELCEYLDKHGSRLTARDGAQEALNCVERVSTATRAPLTLAELEALPVKSAVIEVNTEDIWQSFTTEGGIVKWCFDGIEWTSEGLLNDCGPVVLLFRPEQAGPPVQEAHCVHCDARIIESGGRWVSVIGLGSEAWLRATICIGLPTEHEPARPEQPEEER